MRRKMRRMKHKLPIPRLRTRSAHSRRTGGYSVKVIKPALITAVCIIFVLVIIPFTITKLFIPEAPSDKTAKETTEKANQSPDAANVSKVSVPKKISVYRKSSGKTKSVAFEDYVKGVVASEMPSTFEKEALKAQAVAARTYSLSRYQRAKTSGNPSSHPQAPVCDTVHCQVYQDESDLKRVKGEKWMKSDWPKISAAVEETKGQLMYYNGKLVEQALFHSSSGGKTENCEDVFSASVPYLVSVSSPYEEDATHKQEAVTLSVSKLAEKIKAAYPKVHFGTISASNIKILSRSTGGRVEKMKIGSGTLTGVQVRQALDLYSANFKIRIAGNKVTFTTTGSGHGVGMSQYGANGMAKAGYQYKEILSHYYSGTVIL